MNEREIDTWLTMEIEELSRNEEIFAPGPGYQGERLRLAARARLMAETALTVAGVDTKNERHNLHQMLDQLRNPVCQKKAEHLDDHYVDAATFYCLTGAPKTLWEYWHRTANTHINYHLRYAPAKSETEKRQAASGIDKVSLVLDVEMLRALHAILDESWPQCSMPYAHLASVRAKSIVLDELVMAARGNDAFIEWCRAHSSPMDVFWLERSQHPDEETARALDEAMQRLKRLDHDPAVRWLLLPFHQIEMWERLWEKLQRQMSLIANETDKQRSLDMITKAKEHINRIRREHSVPKSRSDDTQA